MMEDIIRLGTETPWGVVSAVLLTGGERFYMMVKPGNAVASIPADVVEAALKESPDA